MLTYSIQSQNCQVETIAPIEGRVMFLENKNFGKNFTRHIVGRGPCAPPCQTDKGTAGTGTLPL